MKEKRQEAATMSKKILVAYFSCSGTTARAAKELARAAGADLFEIRPETPYAKADLNWMDMKSRSSREMNDPESRPAVSGRVENMEQYDAVFVGFPIWWYTVPTIVNTFLESYDLSGKTVIPFATSGGSDLDRTEGRLKSSCSPKTVLLPGKLLNRAGPEDLVQWVKSLGL
jgi:flavodoxin